MYVDKAFVDKVFVDKVCGDKVCVDKVCGDKVCVDARHPVPSVPRLPRETKVDVRLCVCV